MAKLRERHPLTNLRDLERLSERELWELSLAQDVSVWKDLQAGCLDSMLAEGLFQLLAAAALRTFQPPDYLQTLFQLDRERGTKVLLKVAEQDNHRARMALIAFYLEGLDVPIPLLLRYFEAYEDCDMLPDNYLKRRLYETALHGLCRQGHPLARPAVEKILEEGIDPKEYTDRDFRKERMERRQAAAHAQFVLEKCNREHFYERRNRLERHEMELVERPLLSDADVIQYQGFQKYFDEVGYDPREDVVDLHLLGAPGLAGILECALTAFGPEGPPADRAARQARLKTIGRPAHELWAESDRAWRESPEGLDALEDLYFCAHREELASLPQIEA